MDTRSKILTVESALALDPFRPLAMAVGLFDILRAGHTREIAEVRSRVKPRALLAVVLRDPAAVLSERARAELAAGLRMIDYVVAADDADFGRIAAALRPEAIVHLEDADRLRVEQLIEHVRRRQAR